MDVFYRYHQMFLNATKASFRRDLISKINWTDRMIGIKGARGVGKTTLLAQHITESFRNDQSALYVSMDNLAMKGMSLFEIAEQHYQSGGTHLFVDEVHKYVDWSFSLKNIYDLLPDLHVVFTGSSMLAIHKSQADLSRRAIIYELHGLSLREFINIELGLELPAYSLEEILTNHLEIAQTIASQVKILKTFGEYLEIGYYPFYLEGKSSYGLRLEQTINTILDVDLAYSIESNVENIYKLKKLLHSLANSVPFQPNISKLAGSFEFSRNSLNKYLYQLDEACLLTVLLDHGKFYSHISKPEKIYMHNPNLIYAFSNQSPNVGTIRETFFVNQMRNVYQINYVDKGDFLVNEKYIFEIGGKGKTYKQIADLPDSYIVSDELITGVKNKIPIWLFGFLY